MKPRKKLLVTREKTPKRAKKDILNIPGLVATEVLENKDNYLIKAEIEHPPETCPRCKKGVKFSRYGPRKEVIRDTSMHDKKVAIEVTKPRYKCKECEKIFLQEVPGKASNRDCTERLVTYIKRESVRRTFLDVAQEVGIDEKTVRSLFIDYAKELETRVRFETPRWMGVDEVFIRGHYIIVITNLEHRTVVELLSPKNKPSLVRYFAGLPDAGSVELVSMDMDGMFMHTVREWLPNATIVLDKFHINQHTNRVMTRLLNDIGVEQLAKDERQAMRRDRFGLLLNLSRRGRDMTQFIRSEAWMNQFPELRKASDVLQSFYAMWECEDGGKARHHYAEWRAKLPDDLQARFQTLLNIFETRPDDVFSYFNTPITNAYTESANGKIKQIHSLGRGYNFPVLRAKVLYGSDCRVSPRYHRPPEEVEFQRVLKEGTSVEPVLVAPQRHPLFDRRLGARAGDAPEYWDADIHGIAASDQYASYGSPFESGKRVA